METEQLETLIQIFILKNDKHLIAELEQFDEEPSCYLKNVYEIVYHESYTKNSSPSHKLGPNSLLLSTEIDIDDEEYTIRRYVVFEKYPLYSRSNEFLLCSNEILTAYEPQEEILQYYKTLV